MQQHNGYNLVNPSAAYAWHDSSRPWKVRLVFVGPNDDNKKSGRSAKFWEMYSAGKGLPVYINYGRIGAQGQRNPRSDKDYWAAKDVMTKKLDKGYRVVKGSTHSMPVPPEETPEDLFLSLIYRIKGSRSTGYWAEDVEGHLITKLTGDGAMSLLDNNAAVEGRSTVSW